jgi:hypothetical protein
MPDLSDIQWRFLDLLMRARERGVSRISRLELLHTSQLPDGVKLKLTWAGLTMPKEFVVMHGQHDFEITAAGIQLYNLRFGKGQKPATPTKIADAVICLPDLTERRPDA